jgi:hypothetical protein
MCDRLSVSLLYSHKMHTHTRGLVQAGTTSIMRKLVARRSQNGATPSDGAEFWYDAKTRAV